MGIGAITPFDVALQVDPTALRDANFSADNKVVFGWDGVAANADVGRVYFDAGASVFAIESTEIGAGTARDMVFRTGAVLADSMTIKDTGEVLIGPATFTSNGMLSIRRDFDGDVFVELRNDDFGASARAIMAVGAVAAGGGSIQYNGPGLTPFSDRLPDQFVVTSDASTSNGMILSVGAGPLTFSTSSAGATTGRFLATGEFLINTTTADALGVPGFLVLEGYNGTDGRTAAMMKADNVGPNVAAQWICKTSAGSGFFEVVGAGAGNRLRVTSEAGIAGGIDIGAGAGDVKINSAAANITFFTSATDRGRFTATGDFVVGSTVTGTFIRFFKDTNAVVVARAENTNGGALSQIRWDASSDVSTAQFGHTSSTFTTAFGIVANEGYVSVNPASASLAVATLGASPIRFLANTLEEMRLLSGGGLLINATAQVGAEQLRVTAGTVLFDFTSTTAFQVAQTGGGTPALVVDTTNTRVGIGGAPGAFALDVTGDVQVTGKLTVGGAIDPTFIRLTSGLTSNVYVEWTNGATVPVSNLNEGRIRYNAATQSFEVSENGGVWADLSVGGNVFLQGGNSFGSDATLGTNDAFALAFETSASERGRIALGGFWSIGSTASADVLFHVRRDVADTLTAIAIDNRNATGRPRLLIGNNTPLGGSTSYLEINYENSTNIVQLFAAASAVEMQFSVAGAGFQRWLTSGFERMRLDSIGRLLVGISAPIGSEFAVFSKNQNTDTFVRVSNTDTGALSKSLWIANSDVATIQMGATSSGFATASGINLNEGFVETSPTTVAMVLVTHGAFPIRFLTNNVEEMRLLSGGGLLINATAQIGTEQLRLTAGTAIFDFTSTTAFQVTQTGGGTPALIVDTTNGRVGIGMTPTETLHVNGNIRLGGDFDILPNLDNTGEIGTDALRWQRVRAVTVATGDLELYDPASGAQWTIKEGLDEVFFINCRTGKTYKAVLQEVA